MWPVLSYIPGGASISRVVIGLLREYGWTIFTHSVVAVLAAWSAWTWASDDPVREEVPAPEIPDIRVEPPEEVKVARDTTTVMDTTCAAVPDGIVPDETPQNGLPEVTYQPTERPPYITVEVTRHGPTLEVTPSTVTLQGYDPAGNLRSYRYERDIDRFRIGGYTQAIFGPERTLTVGIESALRITPQTRLTGRVGKALGPGWSTSFSLSTTL